MSIERMCKSYFFQSCLIIFINVTSAREVEKITTFESKTEMGVLIYLSEPGEYIEEISQSPPQILLRFPKMGFVQGRYSKQISLPPMYRVDAVEKRADHNYTEVVLRFTSLPEFNIILEEAQKVQISWKPKSEDVLRRTKARRISNFEATVSLNFKDAKLLDILRLLAVQNNLNIIASEDVKGEVTVSLRDVTLGSAMDAILKVNGYDWFLQENIVVIKPADFEMTGELITRVYKLEYVDAGAVSTALVNVITPKGKLTIFSPVAKGGMGGAGGVAGGAGGAAAAGGGGGGLLSSLAGGITGGATGGAALGGGAAGAGGVGGAGGGAGIPAYDHLLVTDVFWNFERIEEIIYRLDRRIPQINIAVKFIETVLSTEERLGINWNMRATLAGPEGAGTETGTDGTGSLAELGGGWLLGSNRLKIATLSVPVFSALLEILSTDNNTRLIQEPQVTTFDNTMASVSVGTSYPIVVPQAEGGLVGSQPVTFDEQDIEITLNVQPRINEGRFVSMTINATIQALVKMAGPLADRPVISERSTQTQVMVGDAETLLIGGLIFDHQIKTETAPPVLGNIPILKKLFTHSSTTSEQRELLIFITPTIVKMN